MRNVLVAAVVSVSIGAAAVTVPSGVVVTVSAASSESYELEGGVLEFAAGCSAYSGAISGYGMVLNSAGAPIDFSGASITASGKLSFKASRTLRKRYIRFTSLSTWPRDPTFSNQGPQLDEIELLSNGVVVPYSGHTVTCTSGGSSYDASAVFDNNNLNKNFIPVGSGTQAVAFTVDLGAETEFDAYRFYVGNDCPGRDPNSWTFEVSDDGVAWTLIHSVADYRENACLRYSPTENFRLVDRYDFFTGAPAVTVPAGSEIDVVGAGLRFASGHVLGRVHLVDGAFTVAGEATFGGSADGDGLVTLDGVNAGGAFGAPVARTCRYVRFTPTRSRGGIAGDNGYISGVLEGWALSRFNLTLGGERVEYPAGTAVTLHSRDASMNGSYAADAQNILVDDNNSIYFGLETATPIVIAMPEAVTFDGYDWWSRGDMPRRDPRSWTFEVSDDGENWVMLETVIDCPYQELADDSSELRNAKICGTTFTEPGLTIEFLNGASFSGDYTGAGTIVREDGRVVDFSTDGETIRYAPNGDFRFAQESELPGKALDFTGGRLVYTGAEPLELDGYDLRAVSGASEIRIGAGLSFANSSFSVAEGARLAVQGDYALKARYYRFTSLAVRPTGANAGQGPAMGEIELLRSGATIPYSGASIVCECEGNAYTANGIIDNNVQSKAFIHVGSGSKTVVFTVDLGAEIEFDAYRWWSADQDGRDPYSWTFEVSDDGEAWRLVDSHEAYLDTPLTRFVASDDFPLVKRRAFAGADNSFAVAAGGELALENVEAEIGAAGFAGTLAADNAEVTVVGPSTFAGTVAGSGTVRLAPGAAIAGQAGAGSLQHARYVRFTSLRTRPDGTYQNGGPQIMELQLTLDGSPVPYDLVRRIVTATPAIANGNPSALADNNLTPNNKVFWQVNSGTIPVAFTIDLGSEVEFDGYRWYSGNDAPGRDPYNWRFEVSADGENWILLDEVTGTDTIPPVEGPSDNTSHRNEMLYDTSFADMTTDLFADDAVLRLAAGGVVSLDGVCERVLDLAGAGEVAFANDAVLEVTPSAQGGELFTGALTGSGTLLVRGGRFRYRKMSVGPDVQIICRDGGELIEVTGLVLLIK